MALLCLDILIGQLIDYFDYIDSNIRILMREK